MYTENRFALQHENIRTDQFKSNDQRDRKILLEKTKQKPGRIQLKRNGEKLALLGWNLASIEAADQLNRPFVVVSLPEFESYAREHGIPFVAWNFDSDWKDREILKQAEQLYKELRRMNVGHAVPLFEETVEWAGALNALFHEDPRLFDHALLFRNKAMMKRRAHLGGLRVGIFEEGNSMEEVRNFFRRVNQVLLRGHGHDPSPIHVKALDKAGAAGHRMILHEEEIDRKLDEDHFPCLMESHLEGIEISCEAFIHNRKVLFVNITEYVVFGYSMMVPASPEIDKYRPQIREQVQKIVEAFDIPCGIIHPEFFIAENGEISFGEVAYRIPGGHIFELMQKTYHFNPYQAHILCCDPNTREEELKDWFPDEKAHNGHAGSFLVYPRVTRISALNIPQDLEEHPAFERHTLFLPANPEVKQSEGYGNHYGTIFFYSEDCEQVRQPLRDYVEHDFYV